MKIPMFMPLTTVNFQMEGEDIESLPNTFIPLFESREKAETWTKNDPNITIIQVHIEKPEDIEEKNND